MCSWVPGPGRVARSPGCACVGPLGGYGRAGRDRLDDIVNCLIGAGPASLNLPLRLRQNAPGEPMAPPSAMLSRGSHFGSTQPLRQLCDRTFLPFWLAAGRSRSTSDAKSEVQGTSHEPMVAEGRNGHPGLRLASSPPPLMITHAPLKSNGVGMLGSRNVEVTSQQGGAAKHAHFLEVCQSVVNLRAETGPIWREQDRTRGSENQTLSMLLNPCRRCHKMEDENRTQEVGGSNPLVSTI